MTNERWIICWREVRSMRVGALRCPGDGSEKEARANVKALSVLFPERSFWIQPDKREFADECVVIKS